MSTVTIAPTLFAIIASYQVHENYSDDPVTNPYWKAKGGQEVVVHKGLTCDQVQLLGTNVMDFMVAAARPENCDYWQYSRQSWELVSLNYALIDYVRGLIEAEPNDVMYARFNCKFGEYAFDWAVNAEPSLVSGYSDTWNAGAVMQLLGLQRPTRPDAYDEFESMVDLSA